MFGRHTSDFGALIFGGLILFVGGYYFLRNTLGFNLGELNGEALWPIFVIGLGGAILARAYDRSHSGTTQ